MQLAALGGKTFAAINPRHRIVIGTAVLLAIVAAIAISVALRSHGSSLFARPLEAEQLSEVQQKLDAWEIPYSLVTDNVVVDRASGTTSSFGSRWPACPIRTSRRRRMRSARSRP